ncbi:DUF5627 domain-containing protein [Mangrovibacterium marinum]|uniref:DUF5627 domain-containing protein n=1 Tax=Mangrovibacterium marinum TaxID=1639118 RepID=UPI002A18E00F|nr:DUF5627 domain-containing protein [Mangrovibacterium marinum]
MKQFKLILILSVGLFSLLVTSCHNQEFDFPDYDYSSVYFAYQYPVRTIVLGEDRTADNTLDNEHKCKIYATMGGVYSNDNSIAIDIAVDNSLCNNLYFDEDFASPVTAMPSNYFSMAADQIVLDKTLTDGVEIQLTDAFFADPDALTNTYVIPLRMTSVANADSILSGQPKSATANSVNPADWDVLPKDYVLYCVKFINPWHGYYLRRGVDQITEGASSTTNVRHETYVEDDEVCEMTTASLTTVEYPVSVVNTSNVAETCTLLLTFNGNGCTVSTNDEGFTASGSGSYVVNGEKNSWGNTDRSAIYLDYTIDMDGKTYATKDTLVARNRGVVLETFSPSYNEN